MNTPPTTLSKPSRISNDAEQWDLSISANRPLFSLGTTEVWRYRDLLYLLIRRDLVAFYKQTILGPAWFVIQPICMTIVFVIIFGEVAKLSTDGLPKFLFYMCGITLWSYFAECFNKTATVFRDNASLFGKVYFPRIVLPISIVLSNMVRFAIQLLLFVVIGVWYYIQGSIEPQASIIFFPIVVATMATLGLACGMLFSAMTTKYRDLIFLLQFGVQLLMYATAVIYPFSAVPDRLRPILSWNPLNPLFEITRHGFLGAGEYSLVGLAYSITFSLITFLIALVMFNQVERTFMDTV